MPSAAALNAGQATIELSLLEQKMHQQMKRLRAQLLRGFRHLSANVAAIPSATNMIAGPQARSGVGIWDRIKKSVAALPASASRFRSLMAQVQAMRFPTLLSLRNLFVASAVTTGLAWPIKLAANIEVASAQLGVFVGGVDVARKMLLELQEFSSVSMVPFESLSRTAALLVRYGQSAGAATKNTEALAVLAAGDAEEFEKLALAFAQVGSAGRLQGEEMRQFKNTAFNPLREIAERTGETMDEVKKRMEAGGVSFDEVASALQAAVGPAGRFHGLLDAIAGTMLGQMRRAWAQFKLAILPIGEELLAPLTKFFRAISGAMPAFAEFVRQNSGVAKIILATLAVVAIGAIAFTALGLSINLLAISASGVATAFGLVVSVLGVILSPIGLVVVAIATLAAWFVTSTDAGRTMVNNLGMYFGSLLATAQKTFAGIRDALIAGDIQLAATVLWAGLKLAWLQGTDGLRRTWNDFKDVFMRTTISIVFDAIKLWVDYSSMVRRIWGKLVTESRTVGEKIGHYLSRSSDPVLAAEQDAAHKKALAQIEIEGQANQKWLDAERKAMLAKLDVERRFAEANQDRFATEEIDRQRKALKDAQRELDELRKKAAEAAENPQPGKDWFGEAVFGKFAAAGMAKAIESAKPIATFDTRLAQQMFGKTSDAELEQLKKIERNTRRQNGGIPVI